LRKRRGIEILVTAHPERWTNVLKNFEKDFKGRIRIELAKAFPGFYKTRPRKRRRATCR